MRHPKKQPTDDPRSVTLEEATQLIEGIALAFSHDSEESAQFLLLCHVFTYSRDGTREHMMRAVEKACAPYIKGFDESLNASMAGVLAGMRKG